MTYGPTGTAFVALLPFDILVAGAQVTPVTAHVDGRRHTFYWPFWNEEGAGRRIEPVRVDRIPVRPGLPDDGVQPIHLRIDIQPPKGTAFANGLRIDIDGVPETSVATETASRLLQQFRLRTGQWWIGRSHREGEGIIRAAYHVNHNGAMAGRESRAGMVVEPRFGVEQPLQVADFFASCSALAADEAVPPYLDIFYDALYFAIHDSDRRRALLEACIACDTAVIYQAIRAGDQVGKPEDVVRRTLSDRDLLANLRRGLPALFGSSANFATVSADDFNLIRKLWAARGSIAHGLSPSVGALGRAELPSQSDAAELMRAAHRLLCWLEGLPHTSAIAPHNVR